MVLIISTDAQRILSRLTSYTKLKPLLGIKRERTSVTRVWAAKDHARVNTSSQREIKTKRETGRGRGRNKILFKSVCRRLGDSAVM